MRERIFQFMVAHKLYGVSEFLVKVVPLTGEDEEGQRARAKQVLAHHISWDHNRIILSDGRPA